MICLHHPDSRDFSPEEIISSFEMRVSAKNGRRMLAAAAITAALGITLIAISFASPYLHEHLAYHSTRSK